MPTLDLEQWTWVLQRIEQDCVHHEPLSSNPRSVFKPESVKYWQPNKQDCNATQLRHVPEEETQWTPYLQASRSERWPGHLL